MISARNLRCNRKNIWLKTKLILSQTSYTPDEEIWFMPRRQLGFNPHRHNSFYFDQESIPFSTYKKKVDRSITEQISFLLKGKIGLQFYDKCDFADILYFPNAKLRRFFSHPVLLPEFSFVFHCSSSAFTGRHILPPRWIYIASALGIYIQHGEYIYPPA